MYLFDGLTLAVKFANLLNCFLFNLIVDQPEITTTDPGGTEIIERGDLTLTCSAAGNPTPSISRPKDGSLINTGGDPRINITEQNTKLLSLA